MNRQVLVIDDSDKIHKLIRAILAKEPVDLHSATDPKHGLVLAASLRPELILLDIDMPGMDGFDAARRLKANPDTADCPIIFLTAHNTSADKVAGFGLGAVDYVTKPFNAAELCMRVRASLKTSRTIRKLEETSLTDPLTGLGNRAMFDGRLNAEVGLHARSGAAFSVIALDIERFDTLNAVYGSRISKQVLKHVGRLVADLCRPEDVACRIGRSDFAILAPHTTAAEAADMAATIAAKVARTRFALPADRVVQVTLKTGVAVTNQPYDRSALDRAQAA